jgi:hypothetical protein
MFRLILPAILVGAALFLGGCASEPKSPLEPQSYNTIPWNKPQPGEGAMMGGMMNTH